MSETPGDSSVSVTWTSPTANGSPIVRQVATASPGGRTCASDDGTACTIVGLANGTPYTVTVVAVNARGAGPPSVAGAAVVPQLGAGGSPGIAYLGPVFAKGESPTATLQRDAGFSVLLPNGKDLWIFGDTGEFTDASGWTSTGFVGGSTFAKGRSGRHGPSPSLKNAEVHGALTSEGGPTQFIPAPTDVYLPDGSRRLCTDATGDVYSARWPTGASTLTGSELLVSYVDVCVQPRSTFTTEGWGFMEFNWRSDRIHVGPTDVIPPTVAGTQLTPAQSLGSPVVTGGSVTFFSSTCAQLFVTCSTGSVLVTSLPDTVAALGDPGSYHPQPTAVADGTGWQPMGIAVAADGDGTFTLVEQTSIGGTFRVFGGRSPDGPWTPEAAGTLPGCSSAPHGFCYAFVDHPELGTPTQLVVSYFQPDAGPDPAAGHLVLASVPVSAPSTGP